MKSNSTFNNAMEAVRHIGDPVPPWGDILETAKSLVGADAATLIMVEDGVERLSFLQQTGVDAAAEQEYRDFYYRQDVIAQACVSSSAGIWWDSYELERRPGGSRLPFFADFMSRHRTRQVASFVLLAEATRRAGISFQRTTPKEGLCNELRREPIRAFTDALMSGLSARSSRIQMDLSRIEMALSGFEDALFLVSVTGSLSYCSSAAWALLEKAGLVSRQGRTLTHKTRTLRTALLDALRRGATATTSLAFCVPTGWGTGVRLQIATAPKEYHIAHETLLLVRASAIDAFDLPGVDEIASFFNLTIAEARVLVALVGGHSVQDIASAHRVAENTVRNHVASLLQKMSCSRQAELVRLGSLLR